MTEVEDESIQLVVTSPPYNVGKEYAKHDDNMDLDGYLAFLYRVWTECKRVLCKGGRIAINVADTGRQPYIPLHSLIIDQLLKLNFSMRGVIIWDKGATVGVSTAWGSWRSAGNPTLRDTGEHIVVMDKPDETDRPILRYHEPIVVFSKDAYKLQSKNMISTITSDQFTEYKVNLANLGRNFQKRPPRTLSRGITEATDSALYFSWRYGSRPISRLGHYLQSGKSMGPYIGRL